MAGASALTKFTDVVEEPVDRWLVPKTRHWKAPLLSLNEAIRPLGGLCQGIETNAHEALRNCAKQRGDLTTDEAAAVYLFTMEVKGQPNLCGMLNRTLRTEDERQFRPWSAFLKLLLTALNKLPESTQTVYRGARGVNLRSKYPDGAEITWHGISVCTTKIDTLTDDQFLGDTGVRTLFLIERATARSVAQYACSAEWTEAALLMPGSTFRVVAHSTTAEDLNIICLRPSDERYYSLETACASSVKYCAHSRFSTFDFSTSDMDDEYDMAIRARPFDDIVLDPPTNEKSPE